MFQPTHTAFTPRAPYARDVQGAELGSQSATEFAKCLGAAYSSPRHVAVPIQVNLDFRHNMTRSPHKAGDCTPSGHAAVHHTVTHPDMVSYHTGKLTKGNVGCRRAHTPNTQLQQTTVLPDQVCTCTHVKGIMHST